MGHQLLASVSSVFPPATPPLSYAVLEMEPGPYHVS